MTALSEPSEIMVRLEEIERQLAFRQNQFAHATEKHFHRIREQKRQEALAITMSDAGTVTERKAQGTLAAFDEEEACAEAEYEGLKAVVGVLDKRGMILMSLLRAHGKY